MTCIAGSAIRLAATLSVAVLDTIPYRVESAAVFAERGWTISLSLQILAVRAPLFANACQASLREFAGLGSFGNFIFASVVCSLHGTLRADGEIYIECRRGRNNRAGPGCSEPLDLGEGLEKTTPQGWSRIALPCPRLSRSNTTRASIFTSQAP